MVSDQIRLQCRGVITEWPLKTLSLCNKQENRGADITHLRREHTKGTTNLETCAQISRSCLRLGDTLKTIRNRQF